MPKLFGTDGIRGKANVDIDSIFAYNVGQAAARVLKNGSKPVKIVIARDTRLSGDMLYHAIAAGIMSQSGDVIDIGILPTPAAAYFIKKCDCDAGIVISASHNPFSDNGIKIFDRNGYKLDSSIEEKIEELILNGEKMSLAKNENIGKNIRVENVESEFISRYVELANCDLSGMKIVLDCANGAASHVAPKIFKQLGAETVATHCMPNGVNVNLECGSTDTTQLSINVVKNAADFGVAYDGDADRLICVDEKGDVLNGDKLITTIALDMKKQGKLNKNTIVCTSMSNLGMRNFVLENGIKIKTSDVGDSYVAQMMRDYNLNLGGEQSGHVILSDYATTGDGILTSIVISRIIKEMNVRSSEINNLYKDYPQVMININVPKIAKTTWDQSGEVMRKIQKSEDELGNKGRVLVRASGTENLIRVMLEGEDFEFICREAEAISEEIKKTFPL